jgi:hypothetical protein
MVRSQVIALGAMCGVMLNASLAIAQGSVAEQLFIEGKALSAQHDYEKACPKFKASHDLDPTATGTLLNLALCHEQVGKLATAWAEFRQVAAEAAGRREDRVTMAREHEAKLRPLLCSITVVVPPAARAPGLRIQLDHDAPILEAGWDTPIPVDPGEHVLEASAPAKLTSAQRFTVAASGDAHEQRIVVASLGDAPEERVIGPLAPAAEPNRTRRAIGFGTVGIGILATGIGAIFGLNASSKNRQATRMCSNDVCADEATRVMASDTLASAHSSAVAANVLVTAGLVAVAGGLVLVLAAPRAAVPQ